MRLIDADKFGEDLMKLWDYSCDEGVSAIAVLKQTLLALNNAPTVIWCSETSEGYPLMDLRPKECEREFIEILAQYTPDDLCTYPEYKGKPYYSIHYKENGEEFVGYGTYKIEVLSMYLRDYFFNTDMKGGAE